jgi:hypothetical protein
VALRVGLLKMAYLATFEFLGDAFLDDALNSDWRKSIRAHNTGGGFRILNPQGTSIAEKRNPTRASSPECLQHLVAVFNTVQLNPVAVVKPFGKRSLLCAVSENSSFGLREMEGRLVICDAQLPANDEAPQAGHVLKLE